MRLSTAKNLHTVTAEDLFEHYRQAFEDHYWPGIEGNKMLLLEYMSPYQAGTIITRIERDEVEALALNPELKKMWLEKLKLLNQEFHHAS